jgi:hypothetical protein
MNSGILPSLKDMLQGYPPATGDIMHMIWDGCYDLVWEENGNVYLQKVLDLEN